MKYSPRPFERLLTAFITRQTKLIEELINQFAIDATAQTMRFNPSKTEDFLFRDYPALSRTVDTLLGRLSRDITRTIQAGTEWSWELANTKNDNMLSKILDTVGRSRVPESALARWNQKNLPALAAFQERKIGGMGLSDKVWAYTRGIKGDLELALDLGIGEGMSADRLSRAVRSYLKEPDRLYRRVRDEKGVLHLSKNAANYHPGQGVYRSSYKNAKRLAATETNMAYRTADNERMNQIDFILGFEVHLSNNHTCLDSHGVPQPFYDICDELQGQYPKWFIFKGWHPNCRCYVTTLLPDQDEFVKYLAAMDENGVSSYHLEGEITDIPPQMKEWLRENEYRTLQAKSLPYFIKDNPGIAISEELADKIQYERMKDELRNEERAGTPVAKNVKSASRAYLIEDNLTANIATAMTKAREVGPEVQGMAERIAEQYGALVTPINYKSAKSIKRKCRAELAFPAQLKDTVRTTIIASSDAIPSIIRDLQSQPGFLRWKQQLPKDFLGYSGNIINFTASNGVVAEIQVNTARMIYAKENPKGAKAILGEALWNQIYRETGLPGGLGHRYYEKIRVLPEGDPVRMRLEKVMERYYSHFI